MRVGEYAVGWIKRGPSGVIGTNKKDAQETVDATARGCRRGALLEPADPDPDGNRGAAARPRQPQLVTLRGLA